MKGATTVDAYIADAHDDVRPILERIRGIVRDAAPEAVEGIAYGMPGYKLNGKPLVYYAAFANHIGLYATPTGHEAFRDALAGYKQGKGSVQFPLTQEMPWDLIEQIVRYRVTELTPG